MIDTIAAKVLAALTEPVSLVLFFGFVGLAYQYLRMEKFYRERDDKRADQTVVNVAGLVGAMDRMRDAMVAVNTTLAIMKDRERDR